MQYDLTYKTSWTRKTWRSKLASAFRRSSKTQKKYLPEDFAFLNQVTAAAPVQQVIAPIQLGSALSQQQSLLFSLPTEVRQLIYQHVFGPSVIHVESLGALKDRLAHVTCSKWQSDDGWSEHAHCERGEETGTVDIDNSDDPNDQLSALCLTCRRM